MFPNSSQLLLDIYSSAIDPSYCFHLETELADGQSFDSREVQEMITNGLDEELKTSEGDNK